jgi:poly(A) polymerase
MSRPAAAGSRCRDGDALPSAYWRLDFFDSVYTIETKLILDIGIGHLLLRYGTSEKGGIVKKAHIYTRDEHGIDPGAIDPDAVWVVGRLRKSGAHAYIVGGAVRDLLAGRRPKDFDIATDAHPHVIKRLFRSARIIGRRFRIVHVYTAREKYVEVTTFRSNKTDDANNLFGTMEEDGQRRDFTINALYYCPFERQLIDYVGGYTDIQRKRLSTLIPADASFAEDPVRMIRAVKYACLMGFAIPFGMSRLITKMRELVLECSRERVTEEVYKILTSGASADILALSHRLRLFEVIFPALAEFLQQGRGKFDESGLYSRAAALDERTRTGNALPREEMFGFIFHDFILAQGDVWSDPDAALIVQQTIKAVSQPLFPSKRDLGTAARMLVSEQRQRTGKNVVHAGHRRKRRSRHRSKRSAPGTGA